jgi:hypothetical protein
MLYKLKENQLSRDRLQQRKNQFYKQIGDYPGTRLPGSFSPAHESEQLPCQIYWAEYIGN